LAPHSRKNSGKLAISQSSNQTKKLLMIACIAFQTPEVIHYIKITHILKVKKGDFGDNSDYLSQNWGIAGISSLEFYWSFHLQN